MSTAPLTGSPSTQKHSTTFSSGSYNTPLFSCPANSITIVWITSPGGFGSLTIQSAGGIPYIIVTPGSPPVVNLNDPSRMVGTTPSLTGTLLNSDVAGIAFYMFPTEVLQFNANVSGSSIVEFATYTLSGT